MFLFERCGLVARFPELFVIVRSIVNKMLCLRWSSVQKIGDQHIFCKLHKADLATIMDVGHLDQVFPLIFLCFWNNNLCLLFRF